MITEAMEGRRSFVNVAILVLAAGKASRMGEGGAHKLLAEFDGQPLVRRCVGRALATAANSVVVVTGHRAEDIEAALVRMRAAIVFNPDFASGMASSLQAGLRAAVNDDAEGVLVMLADMPAITTADLDLLIVAFRRSGGDCVVRAVADGRRGNPVILPRSLFPQVAQLQGDTGARAIIENAGPDFIDVEIGPAAHLDIDTPEAVIAAGGILKGLNMDNVEIEEMCQALGPVTIKRMFGGKGIYRQGVIFGLYLFDEVMLKADEESAPQFAAAGARQWVYQRPGGKPVAMPYWSVPDDAFDDPDEMAKWVRLAYDAGLRAEAAKPKAAAGTKPAAKIRKSTKKGKD